MPAFNFKAQFIPKIENGTKGGTIRDYGKRHPVREGQPLYLYFGMRTKYCKKIKEGVCVELWDIKVTERKVTLKRTIMVKDVTFDKEGFAALRENERETFAEIILDTTTQLHQFAISDGFESWGEMKKFWEGKLPYEGFHARWIPLKEHVNVIY